MKRAVLSMAVAALAAASSPAGAQMVEAPLKPVVVHGGLHLVGALPTGEFKDYIDGGIGVGFDVVWPVQREHWFALRADVGWVVYGSESKEVCFGGGVGCRVRLDLTTTNSILYVNAGPQLMMQRGPIRPYINAAGGFSYFSTTSSVKGNNNGEDFASDTNFDDVTMAWTAGGGVLIPVSSGRTPIAINLGAQYHANGSVEYLKEGDIKDNSDGSISFDPTRSEANFVALRLGVSIGIRPGPQSR